MLITMGFGGFYPSQDIYFQIRKPKKLFTVKKRKISLNLQKTPKLYFTIKEI